MVAQDDHYQTLSSRLSLALQASDSPELRALELRHAEQPDDHALAQELAVLYSQVGRQEEALALLFTILKRDLALGDAKKIYLDVLATMGAHRRRRVIVASSTACSIERQENQKRGCRFVGIALSGGFQRGNAVI